MASKRTLVIDERFCGPPGTGNGGYVAGRLATLLAGGNPNQTVEVTLRRPIPLGRALRLEHVPEPEGGVVLRLLDGGSDAVALLAEARLATPSADLPLPPKRPARAEAERASRRFVGFRAHGVPRCFVCGTARPEGDGLRIFPGPLPTALTAAGGVEEHAVEAIAAPWTPDASLVDEDGATVQPEFVWAALDCPGGFASMDAKDASTGSPMLLGRIMGRVTGAVRASEPCIVVAWRLGAEGRKRFAGSAVLGEDGGVRGIAKAIWFAPAG